MPADTTDVLLLIDAPAEQVAQIRAAVPNARIRTGPSVTEPGVDVPGDVLADCECLLCEYPPANLAVAKRLRWIQLSSAGYSQVIGLGLEDRGIRVTNGLGNFDVPIAEWNVMMMLLWHRHLLEMLANQRRANWDRSSRFQRELRGSIVGFHGYGGIARETARLAKAMGLVVWALTRSGSVATRDLVYRVPGTGDPGGVLCDRVFAPHQEAEFFGGLDYLILGMPITPQTQGIVGERQLRMLAPHAVLINAARAGLVDEQAFIRCMREGWIRAASCDVHYAYPLPPEHPLWSMPNVVLTPHISGSSASTNFLDRIYDIFAQNLARLVAGEPLLNQLSADQLRGTEPARPAAAPRTGTPSSTPSTKP